MFNFYEEVIPNHQDYLKLSNIRPSLMAYTDADIGTYVCDDKDYSKALSESKPSTFDVTPDGDIYINGVYVCSDFEVGLTDTVGEFNLYWFGNSLMFYKNGQFQFLLNREDSLRFLSYGSSKVSTYSLIKDKINVNNDEHVYFYGCLALDFTGPWTPYWTYATEGYYAVIAQNRLIEAHNGEVNYNERYNR